MIFAYQPHLVCLAGDDVLLWTMLVANLTIAAAYMLIPLFMWRGMVLLRRTTTPVPFPLLVVGYIVFIIACGTTHIMAAATLFWPLYRWEALSLIITAAVSVATIGLLWLYLPRMVSFLDATVTYLKKTLLPPESGDV